MRKVIAALVALTFLSGCGTVFGSNERTIPAKNHRLCGVAGGTVAANTILLLFAVLPGVVAFGVDIVTGALWYSDEECGS